MNYKPLVNTDLEIADTLLAFFYTAHNDDFYNLSSKKAKKYKKTLLKNLSDRIDELSDSAKAYFDKDKPATVLFRFLADCKKEYDRLFTENKQAFFNEFSDLPNSTVYALWRLGEEYTVGWVMVGNKFETIVEDGSAYRINLVVENLEASKEHISEEHGYIEAKSLEREGDRYCLKCTFEDYETDTLEEIEYRFSAPTDRFECLNCCDFYGEPWSCLADIATAIIDKSELSLSFCNIEELKLLPILREISFLNFMREGDIEFTLLKELALNYGFKEIAKVLSNIEGYNNSCKFDMTGMEKKLEFMNKAKYEPMWRELYQKIVASQKDYPHTGKRFMAEKSLEKIRKDIEKQFLRKGYSGTYPDFYKIGNMKGLRLAHSYGMSYFAGFKRRVKYFIHCSESGFLSETVSLTLVSGTDLTKDGKCKDIYSCMFNDNGKRLNDTTWFIVDGHELDMCTDIAIKRAELKPLSKEERKKEYGNSVTAISEFISILLFGGGIFTLLMALVFFPIMSGIALLIGGSEAFGEFLAYMPWGLLIAISWLGFGGLFGLAEIFSKWK